MATYASYEKCFLINVRFDVRLCTLSIVVVFTRPKWFVKMYECLKEQKESVLKGLEKAGIMEAVKPAQDIYTRCENPFDDRNRK